MARFKMISNLMARRKFVAKRFVLAAFYLSVIAMSFHILGIFGPTWMYVEEDVGEDSNRKPQWFLQEGIWLANYCDQYGRNCYISYRDKVVKDLPKSVSAEARLGSHWLEFQILSVASLLCNMMIVISMYVIQCRRDLKYDAIVLYGSILCSLVSCITLLIPVMKTWSVDGSSVVTSWARSSAAVGTLLEFIITIILAFAVYRNRIMKLEIDQRHERRRREMMKRVIVLQGNRNPAMTGSGRRADTEDNSNVNGVPMTTLPDKLNVEITTTPKQNNLTTAFDDNSNDARRIETERNTKFNMVQGNTTDNIGDEGKQHWDQSFLEDNIEETNLTIVTQLNEEESSKENTDYDTNGKIISSQNESTI